MKKQINLFSYPIVSRVVDYVMGATWTLTICVMVGFVLSCKDSGGPANPVACNGNAEKLTNAAKVFSENPNEANCKAYKNSVKDFLNSCPNFYSGSYKTELEEFMNEPCDF